MNAERDGLHMEVCCPSYARHHSAGPECLSCIRVEWCALPGRRVGGLDTASEEESAVGCDSGHLEGVES